MAQLGADVEALETLARKFDEEANKIRQAVSTISNQIQGTWWKGRDADAFRNNWSSSFQRQLNTIAETLMQSANQCRKQAQQQRQVSGG